jgi:hypothetical protein
MLKAMKSDLTRWNTDEAKILAIEKTIHRLNGNVLSGRIFQVDYN